MPTYKYRALNDAGKQIRGKLNADNENDLFQQLQAAGMMLLDSSREREGSFKGFGGKKISDREKIQFFVHLEQLQAAGVPLLDSLSDVRDSTDVPALRDLVSALIKDVSEGEGLSVAFEKHPKVFSELYSALVAAGESSGNLTAAFEHLVHHTKWESDLKARVKKALRYPLISLIIITGMLMFMMGKVVPEIVGFLRAQGQELPPLTVALIATSDFVVESWYVILLTPVVIWAVLKTLVRMSDKIRYQLSCFWLRVPIFGDLTRKLAISRFSHFFAIMFQSGVPILECLETAQRVVVNRCLEEALGVIRNEVQSGEPLSEAMRHTGQFPSLVLRMIKIGEDSGNLGGTLNNVTMFYDKDVDEAIDGMVGMIEPAMTVISGVIMGWIVIGVIGPIYDTIQNLGI